MYRENTKEIAIGNVKIGGTHPVTIQSMTNTKTENVKETVDQILRLEAAGCEIIRCAVPTMEAAGGVERNKKTNSYSSCGRYSFRLQAGRSPRSKTERIRLGSIREISARKKRFRLL